jgi:hypothetical protein
MKIDLISDDVVALIKDYSALEEVKLYQPLFSHRDVYIDALENLQNTIRKILATDDELIIKGITVLFSEFLFAISQVKRASDDIKLKQHLYQGCESLLDLLKFNEETPFNISKISFELRSDSSLIDGKEDSKSLAKKLVSGNESPRTISVKGDVVIASILRVLLSQREEFEKYAVNAKGLVFNLNKPVKDTVKHAIKNELKSLYQFLMDKKVFKSKNATLTKLLEMLTAVNMVVYDKSDRLPQNKSLIKRLDRAFSSKL